MLVTWSVADLQMFLLLIDDNVLPMDRTGDKCLIWGLAPGTPTDQKNRGHMFCFNGAAVEIFHAHFGIAEDCQVLHLTISNLRLITYSFMRALYMG